MANSGSFPETLQGRYQRKGVLWQNEELNKKASAFVRANAAKKGHPNMKIACFARWVNEDLLPNHALESGYPCKLSQETARKWLHELGFCVLDSKKGTYVDGHERQDVTEYRAKFLRKMVALGFLNSENAPTPEAALSLPADIDTASAEQIAKTIVLFNDESTFQANKCEPHVVSLVWQPITLWRRRRGGRPPQLLFLSSLERTSADTPVWSTARRRRRRVR